MRVSMGTSVGSSTTCASPTCLPAECSPHTRTCVSHTLPSLPVKTSRREKSLGKKTSFFSFATFFWHHHKGNVWVWRPHERLVFARFADLTTATTFGKWKARCWAANAPPPSASTRPRPWRRCRRTARQRASSSSPVPPLTPARPTPPPAPLKNARHVSPGPEDARPNTNRWHFFCEMHSWTAPPPWRLFCSGLTPRYKWPVSPNGDEGQFKSSFSTFHIEHHRKGEKNVFSCCRLSRTIPPEWAYV